MYELMSIDIDLLNSVKDNHPSRNNARVTKFYVTGNRVFTLRKKLVLRISAETADNTKTSQKVPTFFLQPPDLRRNVQYDTVHRIHFSNLTGTMIIHELDRTQRKTRKAGKNYLHKAVGVLCCLFAD